MAVSIVVLSLFCSNYSYGRPALRPPNTNPLCFINDLENILTTLSNTNKSHYLCGDFNLNLLNVDTHHHTNGFWNTMWVHLFRPLIEVPARITLLLPY